MFIITIAAENEDAAIQKLCKKYKNMIEEFEVENKKAISIKVMPSVLHSIPGVTDEDDSTIQTKGF
jgi:hypothetical protein